MTPNDFGTQMPIKSKEESISTFQRTRPVRRASQNFVGRVAELKIR